MKTTILALIVIALIAPVIAATPESPRPTREFEIRDGFPYLDGEPVKLWGIRCHNALMSPAVTERLINNLDNMAAHGLNLVGLCLQGTNGGFPDKTPGLNAYAPDGHLIPAYARRLEGFLREADRRGMVICLTLMMPRNDEELRDEVAVLRGIAETGKFLTERRLGNLFVNIYQEFDHPLRADHDIFQEPDGDAKKSRLTACLKKAAPNIEVGICPNHTSGSKSAYPGCDVLFFHEAMPIPEKGFAVNTETPDYDLSGNAGVFNRFHIESMQKEWAAYLDRPKATFLFRSPYLENVRGKLGTGPNFAMGGGGTSTGDRGIRPFYDWLAKHVGPWKYPKHVKSR